MGGGDDGDGVEVVMMVLRWGWCGVVMMVMVWGGHDGDGVGVVMMVMVWGW